MRNLKFTENELKIIFIALVSEKAATEWDLEHDKLKDKEFAKTKLRFLNRAKNKCMRMLKWEV